MIPFNTQVCLGQTICLLVNLHLEALREGGAAALLFPTRKSTNHWLPCASAN